ncbi:hypothetical protein L2E82_30947 [Cichorium intybus]|uniref:Uncharacterized protein n=1 Tax=Cichorium intybus TaxID=13427 RepID=A0ACB9D237_CICIN|nr:hypothetical protein L2E82_30947 [Cichorium intybus]
MQSFRVGHFAESYQAFEKSANAFIQEFRNWESAWALEALYVVVYEIRVLAERSSGQKLKSTVEEKILGEDDDGTRGSSRVRFLCTKLLLQILILTKLTLA